MNAIQGSLTGATTGPAPHIDCYLPPRERHTGVGLIIFPGGGYGGLAAHEGVGYADHFVAHGIAGFVVTYRLGSAGHRHPAMLEDGLAAVQAVRERAGEFGIRDGGLGVMGSSAGGHLTAHVMTQWDQYGTNRALRPDFGVLCYPVISSDPDYRHDGTFNNLLGEGATAAERDAVSCDRLIGPDTPPCFLWHTREDGGVKYENSLLFSAGLHRRDIPFELHVYDRGRHGLGLGTTFDWSVDCRRWIHEITGTTAPA